MNYSILIPDLSIWSFSPELSLMGWFIAYIMTHELNVPHRIKRLTGIRPTQYVKLIDCAPCWTFWISLLVSQLEPLTAVGSYLIATIIDKLENK